MKSNERIMRGLGKGNKHLARDEGSALVGAEKMAVNSLTSAQIRARHKGQHQHHDYHHHRLHADPAAQVDSCYPARRFARLAVDETARAVVDSNKYCAISNKSASATNYDTANLADLTQTMYDITSRQISHTKRYPNQMVTPRRRTITTARHDKLFKTQSIGSLIMVVVALAVLLAPCIFHTPTTQAFFLSSLVAAPGAATSSAAESESPSSLAAAVAAASPAASSPSQSPASTSTSSASSPAAAAAAAALSSLSSSLLSAATGDSSKQSSGERQGGSGASSAAGAASSAEAPSSVATSVAASLSSAVASAAAAAAVAAAQSSLSGNDGRSLFSQSLKSHHHHHQQHHGSHNGNLASKLADAIPEVPYNILHNMRKVDHAAPFYNSPNKLTGSSKESGQHHSSLLANALSSTTAEQLGSFFKSPLWKRIADGYDGFASEFRSIFKAPASPTTMKGPTSSTASKLLRDISVPALLMLVASAIPSDWRPIRTRRKFSLLPSDLKQSIMLPDPMSAAGSEILPATFSIAPPVFSATATAGQAAPSFNLQQLSQPQQQVQQSNFFGRALSPFAQMYQKLEGTNQIARAAGADINLQPMEVQPQYHQQQPARQIASTANWIQPVAGLASLSAMPAQQAGQSAELNQQLYRQQPMRRSGEISLPPSAASAHGTSEELAVIRQHETANSRPVGASDIPVESSLEAKSDQRELAPVGLLSSFTSGLLNQVVGNHGRFMGKLMNANGADNGPALVESYRMSSLSQEDEPRPTLALGKIMKRNHQELGDKHWYSLVTNDNSLVDHDGAAINLPSSQSDSKQAPPKLSRRSPLSAVAHAFSSIFPKQQQQSADHESGLHRVATTGHKPASHSSSLESAITAESLHQRHDSPLRRNQQVAGSMEQRELGQLIPQSWKEMVKRTVNNVQQTASTQWRSIEGQVTNWVQDKLKAFPTSASPSSSSPAPMSNIIASMGSSAVSRIFGLGGSGVTNKSSTVSSSSSTSNSSGGDQASPSSSELASSMASSAGSSGLKSKNDSPSRGKQPITKGALAGVANMIVNTLTNHRSSSNHQSASSKTKSPSANVNDPSSSSTSASHSASQQQTSGNSDFASSSMASGTSSTIAGLSMLGS